MKNGCEYFYIKNVVHLHNVCIVYDQISIRIVKYNRKATQTFKTLTESSDAIKFV